MNDKVFHFLYEGHGVALFSRAEAFEETLVRMDVKKEGVFS